MVGEYFGRVLTYTRVILVDLLKQIKLYNGVKEVSLHHAT
jgi:hypothetical protein